MWECVFFCITYNTDSRKAYLLMANTRKDNKHRHKEKDGVPRKIAKKIAVLRYDTRGRY